MIAMMRKTRNQMPFLPLLAFCLTLAVVGCSGSSDPDSSEPENEQEMETETETEDPDGNPSVDESSLVEIDTESDGPMDDGDNANPTDDPVQTETETETDSESNPPTDVEPEPTPEIPDPAPPTTVRVDFDITVPAYQSSELKIELVWNDIALTASWVGDEYWSATGDFPTETEHELAVTFYDRNGAIELARHREILATGLTTTSSIQISADQFDSGQFDTDGDGVSNLDELIAGTDPTVDEDSLLDVYEFSTVFSDWSRMSVQQSFEYLIPDARPHLESFIPDLRLPFEGFPGDSVHALIFGDVDIDAQGNGTLVYGYYWPIDQLRFSGTRTSSNNSVAWEGTRRAYDGDYAHYVSFTNTVTVIDENTRTFVQEITGSNVATYDFRWETSANLTGVLVEGTSLCKPVAGTFSATYRTSPPGDVTTITTTKEIDDPYWRFIREHDDTSSISTREYFVRELIMHIPSGYEADTVLPEDRYFKCDFVDFD